MIIKVLKSLLLEYNDLMMTLPKTSVLFSLDFSSIFSLCFEIDPSDFYHDCKKNITLLFPSVSELCIVQFLLNLFQDTPLGRIEDENQLEIGYVLGNDRGLINDKEEMYVEGTVLYVTVIRRQTSLQGFPYSKLFTIVYKNLTQLFQCHKEALICICYLEAERRNKGKDTQRLIDFIQEKRTLVSCELVKSIFHTPINPILRGCVYVFDQFLLACYKINYDEVVESLLGPIIATENQTNIIVKIRGYCGYTLPLRKRNNYFFNPRDETLTLFSFEPCLLDLYKNIKKRIGISETPDSRLVWISLAFVLFLHGKYKGREFPESLRRVFSGQWSRSYQASNFKGYEEDDDDDESEKE